MVTPSKTIRRALVALKLHPSMVPALINFTQQAVKSMTGNPSFPTPSPTLAEITTATAELQTAENAALARTKGAATLRNEKRTALVLLLQGLAGYVQTIANANVENSASIIQSAGMAVRKVPVHAPRVFAAKPGKVTGTAALVARSAGPRSSYEWQTSTDGGKTWTSAPATLQAKTTVTGLTPGATVLFRYKSVTKTGEGDWSEGVTLQIK
jgi:hypothetical protein